MSRNSADCSKDLVYGIVSCCLEKKVLGSHSLRQAGAGTEKEVGGLDAPSQQENVRTWVASPRPASEERHTRRTQS